MSDSLQPAPASRPFVAYGSMGPAANRTSMKKINREVHAVLATAAPDLARRMVERALVTEDDRVLAVVTSTVLAHVQGRPTDRPQSFEGLTGGLDAEFLSEDEARHALECAQALQRYIGLVAERRAGIETQG